MPSRILTTKSSKVTVVFLAQVLRFKMIILLNSIIRTRVAKKEKMGILYVAIKPKRSNTFITVHNNGQPPFNQGRII